MISLVAALVAKETRTVDLADVQEEAPATGTATDAAVVIP
ncbi:Uncharacterised protein [Mycobacteroides abscessus subsp. abscessus]|nr:Uncharacterised protein [Mycobacteroides abscessus subsp. abscessus]